jgi:hypothetical protein
LLKRQATISAADPLADCCQETDKTPAPIEPVQAIRVQWSREWETYLELAKVHVIMGELEWGREFLSRAQTLPNMKNFKFRDQEINCLAQELY